MKESKAKEISSKSSTDSSCGTSEIEGIIFGKPIRITENKSHTEDIPCVSYEDWQVLKKLDQEYIILIAKTLHIFDGKIA